LSAWALAGQAPSFKSTKTITKTSRRKNSITFWMA
jgi:hypothetical protein